MTLMYGATHVLQWQPQIYVTVTAWNIQAQAETNKEKSCLSPD